MKEDDLHVATSVCLSGPFPLLVATQPTLTAPGVLKFNDMIVIGGRDDLNRGRVSGLWLSKHDGRREKQRGKKQTNKRPEISTVVPCGTVTRSLNWELGDLGLRSNFNYNLCLWLSYPSSPDLFIMKLFSSNPHNSKCLISVGR